jgi:transposase
VKTITLDVHSEWSQLAAADENGEIFLEMKVQTKVEALRQVVGGISGHKSVIFEEGPMSAFVRNALEGVADEIISCDSTRNALIACAEDSNDQRDARRLVTLSRAKAIHPVYIPEEPYCTLRSLLTHDRYLSQVITGVKNRIKALCRRQGFTPRGVGVFKPNTRQAALDKIPDATTRWQLESLFRQLDLLRKESTSIRRVAATHSKDITAVTRLQSIPGVGPIVARTLVAWIVDPRRFKSRNALSSYAGLGLGQGYTNWKPVGHARASKRGQRAVKRVLFIAANAALLGPNALYRRYNRRVDSGWEHRKAIRDVARTILFIARAIWINGKEYREDKVTVPEKTGRAG